MLCVVCVLCVLCWCVCCMWCASSVWVVLHVLCLCFDWNAVCVLGVGKINCVLCF